MSIRIICLGRTKQKYLEQGIAEFRKRLQHQVTIKLEELPDLKIKTTDAAFIKQKEGDILIKHIPERAFVIVLDENGLSLDSRAFAAKLEKALAHEVVFVIGGAYGLDQRIIDRGNLVLSFSRFTFTHQMIRLLLYEQLYRAFNILGGGQYHK